MVWLDGDRSLLETSPGDLVSQTENQDFDRSELWQKPSLQCNSHRQDAAPHSRIATQHDTAALMQTPGKPASPGAQPLQADRRGRLGSASKQASKTEREREGTCCQFDTLLTGGLLSLVFYTVADFCLGC